MRKLTLTIHGMSCAHCVGAVTGALSALPGTGSVSVDLRSETATLEHDPDLCPLEKIKAAVEDQGYEVVS